MTYNYYPGHMMKAKRAMEEDIRIIDLLIELLDARAPQSTRNPEIDKLAKGKGRMVLLNKSDLADEDETKKWIAYFKDRGIAAISLDSRNRKEMKEIDNAVSFACREKIEKNKKKGIINRPMRAMVVGIPNVGKSTFINSYAGRAAAKTGNKPGVTRGKQWIKLGKNLELLDTPGILWPKIDDETAGFHLALLGSMNDLILNREEMVIRFIRELKVSFPEILFERYGITAETGEEEALRTVAVKRNAIQKGGEPDTDRAISFILDDFRSGKLGKITLDRLDDIADEDL